MAINVSTLPAYVEEHRLPLISKAVLGAKTIDYVSLETGVKGKTALNILATEVVLQDGSTCGFNAQGTSTLSQRFIDPKHLKVNMEFCDKTLLGKWTQYAVVSAAGKKTLPFEEDFINGVTDKVNEAVETMIWQGTGAGAEFTGLCAQISTSAGSVEAQAGATKWESVKAAYAAVPANIAGASDLTIYVATSYFNALVQELISANLYHYNPNDASGTMTLPGTSTQVVAVPGLEGATHKIIVARKSNLYFGTDLLDDKETYDFWYSKDDNVFKLNIEFVGGTGIAFPDEIVFVD